MSEGGEARNHEEIEAVGEAMDAWLFAVHGKVSSLRASEVGAAGVIAALDAVRSSGSAAQVRNGVCLRCGSGVLDSGEHIRDDLPPCYGSSGSAAQPCRHRRILHQGAAGRFCSECGERVDVVASGSAAQNHEDHGNDRRASSPRAEEKVMDSVLRMPGDHCMWCVEPSDVPCQLGCRKPRAPRDSFERWKMEATGVPKPHEMPDLSAAPVSAADGKPLFRSPQGEDHEGCNCGVAEGLRTRHASTCSSHRVASSPVEDHEAGVSAIAWTLGRTTRSGRDYDGPFNIEDYMDQARRCADAYRAHVASQTSPVSGTEPDTAGLVESLLRIKLELRGTTAQGGDAECLLDSLLSGFSGSQEPQGGLDAMNDASKEKPEKQ